MLHYINIFLISLLGMLSSYTDISNGKIPNWLVFPAILAGILLAPFSQSNLLLFLLNAVLAFVFGFVLYLSRLWSAADGKLFLAFVLLFPLESYPKAFVLFPAFAIVLNSFIPAFVALFALSLLRTSRQQKFEALKKAFEPNVLLSIVVILFAFYWLLSYFFYFIPLPPDFFLIVLILFFFVSILERIFPKRMVFIFAFLAALLSFLNINELMQPPFWIVFAIIFLSVVFLRFFILYLGFFAFGRRVEITELKPGMVLLEGVYEKNGLLEKKKMFFPSLLNALQDIKTNYVLNLGSNGLTAENISFLSEKNGKGKIRFHSLLVQETLPFAPLLFVGAILTLFCPFFLPWC